MDIIDKLISGQLSINAVIEGGQAQILGAENAARAARSSRNADWETSTGKKSFQRRRDDFETEHGRDSGSSTEFDDLEHAKTRAGVMSQKNDFIRKNPSVLRDPDSPYFARPPAPTPRPGMLGTDPVPLPKGLPAENGGVSNSSPYNPPNFRDSNRMSRPTAWR